MDFQLHPRQQYAVLAAIMLSAFWIRLLVSVHPYSGANTPPRFGDYEAQRHWMEITLHTPVREWYVNTTNNDLGYWGLDYPPLTAYQSLLHGIAMNAVEPQSVALHTSQGYETPSSKILMRWTVLSSDLCIFFPAAFLFTAIYYGKRKFKELSWALMMIMFQPALILIDHGHFQFNCISLGLTVGAVAAICLQWDCCASILFSLALNHKQMSAYYALAFFSYLFGKSLRQQHPFFKVLKLGIVVILTFVCCWWPFLYSKKAAFEVLSRLAPLHRGIFEDYVANFWCVTSLIIKWKRICSTMLLARLALVATLTASLPSVIQQLKSPSHRGFLLAMFNTALSFYLFSYQVHEKSILLPMLPASLLILEDPLLYRGVFVCAMFSMFPLLHRDGLVVPYIALFGLYIMFFEAGKISSNVKQRMTSRSFVNLSIKITSIIGLLLNLSYLCLEPPTRYPFIFEALISSVVFIQLIILAVYSNLKQWSTSPSIEARINEKKSQ